MPSAMLVNEELAVIRLPPRWFSCNDFTTLGACHLKASEDKIDIPFTKAAPWLSSVTIILNGFSLVLVHNTKLFFKDDASDRWSFWTENSLKPEIGYFPAITSLHYNVWFLQGGVRKIGTTVQIKEWPENKNKCQKHVELLYRKLWKERLNWELSADVRMLAIDSELLLQMEDV